MLSLWGSLCVLLDFPLYVSLRLRSRSVGLLGVLVAGGLGLGCGEVVAAWPGFWFGWFLLI